MSWYLLETPTTRTKPFSKSVLLCVVLVVLRKFLRVDYCVNVSESVTSPEDEIKTWVRASVNVLILCFFPQWWSCEHQLFPLLSGPKVEQQLSTSFTVINLVVKRTSGRCVTLIWFPFGQLCENLLSWLFYTGVISQKRRAARWIRCKYSACFVWKYSQLITAAMFFCWICSFIGTNKHSELPI